MTAKSILQVFSNYKNARAIFVQSVADLTLRPPNIDCLMKCSVLDLLQPLLRDSVASIQINAAIALGRLADSDEAIANSIIRHAILPELLLAIDKQNKYFKKSAMYVLRAISKHTPELAQVVVQEGGLKIMVACLEDLDPGVKESAAWALGYVARHDRSLANAVVKAGAVQLLVICLMEPELCLKQVAASALSDISKHSIELAMVVVDTECVDQLVKAFAHPDIKLKKQALSALMNIAKHSLELAELIVKAEIIPNVLIHMGHPDDGIKKCAVMLVREIVKHSPELSQLVVDSGGIGALVEMIEQCKGSVRHPAVMALGFIAAHSSNMAMTSIDAKAVIQLAIVLNCETEDHILAATVWTVGQIGKHTSEHARHIAAANLFPRLLELYNDSGSSEDLKQKCRLTLKQVLQKCTDLGALEPLLYTATPDILKYVLQQFSKILPNDARARRLFVTTGSLRKIQEIDAEPGTTLMEYKTIINSCYPEEIVSYYSPGFCETLLEKVEQYTPQIPALLARSGSNEEELMSLGKAGPVPTATN